MPESDYEEEQGQAAERTDYEREQEQGAAAEAGAIGGRVSSDPPTPGDDELDPAEAPLREAGQGEAEGFEDAERELIQHASHGDEHAARRVLRDAPQQDEVARASRYGEADSEPPAD